MEIVMIVLLAMILAWGIFKSVQKARRGGGCCGEHEKVATRVSVSDRHRSHYPCSATLEIGGMTCENCARKVANALNSLDGTWASVSISTHQARLRLKSEPDESLLRQAVQQAGYVVTGFHVGS